MFLKVSFTFLYLWVKRFKLIIWRTLTINIFQEQLAVAAQNAVSTIVQLSDVVKAGAASLGSPNQEAQVNKVVFQQVNFQMSSLLPTPF